MRLRGRSLLAAATAGLLSVLALRSGAPVAASSVTYSFPAPPIAVAGSIPPGGSSSFAVKLTMNGVPDPGGAVYLAYLNAYAHTVNDSTTLPAAQCPSGGSTPTIPTNGSGIECFADSNGQVVLTYHTPAQPPGANVSTDFVARSSSTGGTAAITHYVYSTEYRFQASPLAPAGSLMSGENVATTLTADDAVNQGVPGATVALWFTPASGGGTAYANGTLLTGTPVMFTADTTGSIPISYVAPATPPTSGIDTIHYEDRTSYTTESGSDSYDFAGGTPVVSIGDATVTEGDQQPGIPAKFTVSISSVQTSPVTVQYRTICGIGDKGCSEDFTEVTTPVTVTIPANATSTTVVVRQYSYIGAGEGETYNEGWFVELLNPSAGTVGRAIGRGLLLPDPESGNASLPVLSAGDAGLVPTLAGQGTAIWFTVTLGSKMAQPVTFSYSTSDGTALAGTDYRSVGGVATIPAGNTSFLISVRLLPQATPPSSRTFTLTIGNPTGGATINRATGTGTVLAG